MGTLLDIFSVLDGWERDRSPEALTLNADAALQAAKDALDGRYDVRAALDLLEEQTVDVRSTLRAQEFDLIQRDLSETSWSLDNTKRLGSKLHQLAAQLFIRSGRWVEARDHLVRAIACKPDDPDPHFRFAEVYLAMGAYADAYNVLEKTFNEKIGDAPEAVVQLYRLAKEIQVLGAVSDARTCYEQLIERTDAGLFGDIARLQIRNIDNEGIEPPSLDDLEHRYREAIEQLELRNLDAALAGFRSILCWQPDHATTWFLVGSIYLEQAEAPIGFRAAEGILVSTLIPVSIGSARYEHLRSAVQAFTLAILFDPTLTDAHRSLTVCYALLEHHGAALDSAIKAAQQAPEDSFILGTLSMTYFLNLDFEQAEKVAHEALAIDGEDASAQFTLAALDRVTAMLEAEEHGS